MNPDKLELMAENSSLKVKLARVEKSMKDQEDKLSTAQVRLILLSVVGDS